MKEGDKVYVRGVFVQDRTDDPVFGCNVGVSPMDHLGNVNTDHVMYVPPHSVVSMQDARAAMRKKIIEEQQ